MNLNERTGKSDNGSGAVAVKTRVRGWFHEMRKKSHVTVQKWVDSISVATSDASDETPSSQSAVLVKEDEVNQIEKENKQFCDKSELNISNSGVEPSASNSGSGVKEKITELCNKLNVNEKLKSKKIQDFKNLLTKTSQKINQKKSIDMEDEIKEGENKEKEEEEKEVVDEINEEQEKEEIDEEEDQLNIQRCHIGVLGRSCSENPNPPPRSRRLTDIGRSFSVAHDNESQLQDLSENFIYDADEDISIAIPSPTSPTSALSNKINSNSQLDRSNVGALRTHLTQMRPHREHTVSEGHYSPHPLPKNQLLRDSSFQSDESHCSSVENLLELRKPDAEAILINLGFGPTDGSDDVVSKIPKRFLKPSQVKGVDTDTFLKNQQLSKSIHENSVLGYRGLLGNSHVPSDIVKAIFNRFSQNEYSQRMASMENLNQQRSFRGVTNAILAQRQFMK